MLILVAIASCYRYPQSSFPDSGTSTAGGGSDAGSTIGMGGNGGTGGGGLGGVMEGEGGTSGAGGTTSGSGGIGGNGGAFACPKPTSGNVLIEPGFDSAGELSLWRPSEGASWSSDDADGCPQSGSVLALVTNGTFDFGHVQQCVGIQNGIRYFFGYKFKEDTVGAGDCRVGFFQELDCSGSELDSVVVQTNGAPAEVRWIASPLAMAFAPQNAVAAKVTCQTDAQSTIRFDDLFLNPISPDF